MNSNRYPERYRNRNVLFQTKNRNGTRDGINNLGQYCSGHRSSFLIGTECSGFEAFQHAV